MRDQRNIFDVLWDDSRVRANISSQELQASLDPADYLCLCTQITEEAVTQAREAAEKMACRPLNMIKVQQHEMCRLNPVCGKFSIQRFSADA